MATTARPHRPGFCARAIAAFVAVSGAVSGAGLAAGTSALPTDGAAFRSWATTTDLGDAVLPLLVVAAGLALTIGAGLSALYVGLRALGWVRAAQAVGHLVVPRLRRRLDRLVAAGVLASTLMTGTAGSAAFADVVRDPAAADVVREPDGAPAPGPTTVDREPEAPTPEAPTSEAPTPEVPTPEVRATVPTSTSGPAAPPIGPGDHAAVSANAERTVGGPTVDRSGGAGPSSLEPPTPTPDAPASVSSSHTVVAGDNLWSVAATWLAAARGVEPGSLSDHDIATYWVRVVEANRATLRSGNPSLIYAGEVVAMPRP